MKSRRSHVRAGYSMVEMLVMTSVLTMVMSATLSWIHASMKFSEVVKERVAVQQQLSRLSIELRSRIAIAGAIKVDGNTLELETDGQRTRYTIDDSVIEREEEPDSTDDDSILNVEIFRIGGDVEARWGTEELPQWVSLTIRQKPVTKKSGESSTSIGSLETPKLEWYLRAGPRKAGQ